MGQIYVMTKYNLKFDFMECLLQPLVNKRSRFFYNLDFMDAYFNDQLLNKIEISLYLSAHIVYNVEFSSTVKSRFYDIFGQHQL